MVGADFDHESALGKALADRLGAREIARDALMHEIVDASRPERAPLAIVAQDLVEPDADARERERQIEDFAELPVPAHEPQILVEHSDPLADVIERGLQDFAIVLDRRIGVVEQLERRLRRDRALAQQQREHQPRGRGADGGRAHVHEECDAVRYLRCDRPGVGVHEVRRDHDRDGEGADESARHG